MTKPLSNWLFRQDQHWVYHSHEGLNLQYNPIFKEMGWPKLKEIANKVLAGDAVWAAPGDVKGEIGSWRGITYLAFAIPQGPILVVVIDSVERLEKLLNIKLRDILINTAQDGQHKHQSYDPI